MIKSIDREQIQQAVNTYKRELRLKHPEIERIIWFGSWITGLPTPGSDVDLCLIISSSNKSRRDRISKYLPIGFPVGIDLFVYTPEEFERLEEISPQMFNAISAGVEV